MVQEDTNQRDKTEIRLKVCKKYEQWKKKLKIPRPENSL